MNNIIKYQKTKTIQCKENGRSADYTSANFVEEELKIKIRYIF